MNLGPMGPMRVHYASATPTCAGGRADCYDWGRVTCPDCLASRPPPRPLAPGDRAAIVTRSHMLLHSGTEVIVLGEIRRRVYAVGWIAGRPETGLTARVTEVQAHCLRRVDDDEEERCRR